MLAPTDRLVINSGQVAAEVIDGEAIIMNLSNGMYYSMVQVGAVVWEWLGRGHSVGEIVDGLSTHYQVPASQAQSDVEQLLERMTQEGLVQVSPAAPDGLGRPKAPAGQQGSYQRPELNSYGDMAELLALDPPMPTPALSPWVAPQDAP